MAHPAEPRLSGERCREFPPTRRRSLTRKTSGVTSGTAAAGAPLADVLAQMKAGQVDAWIIHLAEGVRDGDRRSGDGFSSRGEFATLKSKGLLTDATVIIHGTALEREDFAAMREAQSIRSDGMGDGRGAKLIWSPLSNLLLYGETANVYEALADRRRPLRRARNPCVFELAALSTRFLLAYTRNAAFSLVRHHRSGVQAHSNSRHRTWKSDP